MNHACRWLPFVLLGMAAFMPSCSQAVVRDRPSIEGSYYLPLEWNFQNTMFRAWGFAEGGVTELMVDRHQSVHASKPVGTYAITDSGFEGMIDGRRYHLSPGPADGDLGISLILDGQEAVSIRLRRRTTAHGHLVPIRRAKGSASSVGFQ